MRATEADANARALEPVTGRGPDQRTPPDGHHGLLQAGPVRE
jgi:hypothetical protein